jgi:hypothetical protein
VLSASVVHVEAVPIVLNAQSNAVRSGDDPHSHSGGMSVSADISQRLLCHTVETVLNANWQGARITRHLKFDPGVALSRPIARQFV